jgi:Ca-activated chloride channel homolog
MPRSLALLSLAACGATFADATPPTASGPVSALGGAAEAAGGIRRAPAVDPVVIRTASVGVAVEAYEPLHDELAQWLGANGGRIADESLTRVDGRASWGTLVLRVPASELDALLGWLQAEYAVERLEVHSQDVTAEWVDLEARLGAMRTTEARLVALVAERTATLADVLAAESELARVRGEIESMEGRRRVIDDQAGFGTVRLDVSVRAPFVGGVSEPLPRELSRAFHGSLGAMTVVGRAALVAAAALAPWLAAVVVAAVVFAAAVRTAFKRVLPAG